jgi:YesN/AraC family two-component response regulator
MSVGFEVIKEIENGDAAVKYLQDPSIHVDHLFVDVEMPIMNGIQVVMITP